MPPRKRLTRDDWVAAALAALVTRGPDAVAVEPVAESLGATKGSGYWHFANRQALLEAALAAWRRTSTDDVVAGVEAAGGTPRERMERLLDVVSAAAERSPAEMLLLGSGDRTVRAAAREAMEARLAYLRRLLVDDGLDAPTARTRAVVAYSTYLGYAVLAAVAPDVVPGSEPDRRGLRAAMLAAVLTDSGPQ